MDDGDVYRIALVCPYSITKVTSEDSLQSSRAARGQGATPQKATKQCPLRVVMGARLLFKKQ